MSAFMCDDKHLSALAFYAVRNRLAGESRGLPRYEQDVLDILWHANRESLEFPYPKSAAEMVGATEPPAFDTSVAVKCNFDPVRVIKAAECVQYQACEYDGFESSDAHRFTKAIIGHAISALPGYDAAPWGAP